MDAVAGADDGDSLPRRPEGEMFEVEIAAGGTGIFGMDVEIGVEGGRFGWLMRIAVDPREPPFKRRLACAASFPLRTRWLRRLRPDPAEMPGQIDADEERAGADEEPAGERVAIFRIEAPQQQ